MNPGIGGGGRGFTLLEVLFAMAIVSIIAVSLFASLGTAYRARESARRASEPVKAVHVALEMIGRDLSCALPPKGILAGSFIGVRSIEGSGLADSLEFYRMAPLAPEPFLPTAASAGTEASVIAGGASAEALDPLGRAAGIQKVELSLAMLTGESLPVLLRGLTGNLLSPVMVEPEVEVLCRHVTSFGARYFDGTVWQENWDTTTLGDVLPGAIQVYLRVEWPGVRSAPPSVYEATRIFVPACYDASAAATASTGTSTGTSTGAGT